MTSDSTLLEKALASPRGHHRLHPNNTQMLDLALAFLTGTITVTQASVALGTSRQSAYQRMMTQFSRAVRDGRIHIGVTNGGRAG